MTANCANVLKQTVNLPYRLPFQMRICSYLPEKQYLRATIVQAIRFGLVGVLNTGITLALIFILMNGLGVHYALSNIIGYLLGFLNSFVLNKKWTFRSKGNVGLEGVLFVAVFGVCYLIQLGALVFMKETMGIRADYAQLLAMAVYTGLNFILNKLITFKNR